MYEDTYGMWRPLHLSRKGGIRHLEQEIEQLTLSDDRSPKALKRLAMLNNKRDKLLIRSGAQQGAQMAVAQSRTYGLAGSGIRGLDVVEQEFGPEVIRGANIDAAGQGYRQTSVAPPGSGRLVPIPFVIAGAVVPGVHVTAGAAAVPGAAPTVGAASNLTTNALNWAVIKLVALTTQVYQAPTASVAVMQDFRMGGSPNLFLVEDWVCLDEYDMDKEAYPGLRAYPVLKSPNTALIQVAGVGGTAGAEVVAANISCICEVLRDDAFGPGIPGAYAL